MKKNNYLVCMTVFLSVFAMGLISCSDNDDEPSEGKPSEGMSKKDLTFNVNGVSFTMVYVKGGTFLMGATKEQKSDMEDEDERSYVAEKPVHSVTLSDYYIGQTEVTQELWHAVMESNPSFYKGGLRPVEDVTWNECQEFVRRLSNITGKLFRLPTEAQWEYAARGGAKSRGYRYSGSNTLRDVAWFYSNSNETETTHYVGQKQPNELGIYDMSGNVSEWCEDYWGAYSSESQFDPVASSPIYDDFGRVENYRIIRGGDTNSYSGGCLVCSRDAEYPNHSCSKDGFSSLIGLRLAL